MVFVEQVGRTGLVVLVIAYGSVSYYKGVDAQVQLAFRLAFRREGVDDELAVQFVRGLGFVYVGFHSEHLSRGDGYPAFGKFNDVDADRQAGCVEHLLVLLVLHLEVVNDDAVQKSEIDALDAYFCAEFILQYVCHTFSCISLYCRNVKQDGNRQVCTKDNPYRGIEYVA